MLCNREQIHMQYVKEVHHLRGKQENKVSKTIATQFRRTHTDDCEDFEKFNSF